MESWQKFALALLRHPRFTKLKQHQLNALRFVELSCRYEEEGRGVVALRDDEIAHDFNLSLDAWFELRNAMFEQLFCRDRRMEDGRKVYEIAFWALPDQADPGGKVRDGRVKTDWPALPTLALDQEEDAAPLTGDKKPGAYRVRKCSQRAKWRNEYLRAHGFLPGKQEDKAWAARYDREHWTEASEQARDANDSPGDAQTPTSTPPAEGAKPPPTNTQTAPQVEAEADPNFGPNTAENVSPNTPPNVSSRAALETKETTNNSFEREEGVSPNVSGRANTHNGADPHKKTVVVLSPVQKELHEVYGVSAAWTQKWTKQHSEAYLRDRMQWVTLEYPGLEKEHVGLLVKYVSGEYTMRGAVVKELNRLAQEARNDAQRAASDRHNKTRSANLQRQQEARAALWQALSASEQAAMQTRAQEHFARENPAVVKFADGDWTRPVLKMNVQKIVDALLDTEIMIGDVKASPGEDHAAAISPDAAI